jgi:hypothetical protein
MIIYVVALLQAAPIAAPPSAPPAPIVTDFAARASSGARAPRENYTVEVEARSSTALIWSGQLRVTTHTGATVRNETIEASHPACAAAYPGATKRFRAELRPAGNAGFPNRLTVSIGWTRPIEAECPLPDGSRTIEVSQTIELEPGRSMTIAGDGGLTVRLTRR